MELPADEGNPESVEMEATVLTPKEAEETMFLSDGTLRSNLGGTLFFNFFFTL